MKTSLQILVGILLQKQKVFGQVLRALKVGCRDIGVARNAQTGQRPIAEHHWHYQLKKWAK